MDPIIFGDDNDASSGRNDGDQGKDRDPNPLPEISVEEVSPTTEPPPEEQTPSPRSASSANLATRQQEAESSQDAEA